MNSFFLPEFLTGLIQKFLNTMHKFAKLFPRLLFKLLIFILKYNVKTVVYLQQKLNMYYLNSCLC